MSLLALLLLPLCQQFKLPSLHSLPHTLWISLIQPWAFVSAIPGYGWICGIWDAKHSSIWGSGQQEWVCTGNTTEVSAWASRGIQQISDCSWHLYELPSWLSTLDLLVTTPADALLLSSLIPSHHCCSYSIPNPHFPSDLGIFPAEVSFKGSEPQQTDLCTPPNNSAVSL